MLGGIFCVPLMHTEYEQPGVRVDLGSFHTKMGTCCTSTMLPRLFGVLQNISTWEFDGLVCEWKSELGLEGY